jgi:hypothetical protein
MCCSNVNVDAEFAGFGELRPGDQPVLLTGGDAFNAAAAATLMGQLTETQISETLMAVQKVSDNNVRLLQVFTPGLFDGDILLFVATLGRPELLPAQAAPGAWRPYVQGAAEIARVILARLEHQVW